MLNTNTIVANANRTSHGSHVAAFAADLLGHKAFSLCCWCLDADASLADAQVHRLAAGGECQRCSYVGADALLVVE